MAIAIHAIQTGWVKIKESQRRRLRGGPLRTLVDTKWSPWLPILCWLVDHPDGWIMVDTGETADVLRRGHLPWWHPYFRLAVQFRVTPDREVGPVLRERGFDPDDVRTVVLTHLHSDHAGGLHHFPNARVLLDEREWRRARGLGGALRGYLPRRWPRSFAPEAVAWQDEAFGPFPRSAAITPDRTVLAVPTPGHTPGHLSVIVRREEATYFLAGDVSYLESAAVDGVIDGVGSHPARARETLRRVRLLSEQEGLVYLPAHDPESRTRLASRTRMRVKHPDEGST